ncbi:helix-turn-helix domain-containing protein [uncultured Pseudoramibacter sp.]|uniref:helix-turn-helix domain-containing protein n=1 Tax=uncultured Pseudoramibacter sp. TaxID=1623493 RepID=UPI0025E0BCAB|nr:helix-turn-helix domain-containing protein [uncultured Pseudoramibacter sp.]
MKVDKKALRAELVLHGLTQEKIAKALGINRDTFRRRMDTNTFHLADVYKMVDFLSLQEDEILKIFFAKD